MIRRVLWPERRITRLNRNSPADGSTATTSPQATPGTKNGMLSSSYVFSPHSRAQSVSIRTGGQASSAGSRRNLILRCASCVGIVVLKSLVHYASPWRRRSVLPQPISGPPRSR